MHRCWRSARRASPLQAMERPYAKRAASASRPGRDDGRTAMAGSPRRAGQARRTDRIRGSTICRRRPRPRERPMETGLRRFWRRASRWHFNHLLTTGRRHCDGTGASRGPLDGTFSAPQTRAAPPEVGCFLRHFLVECRDEDGAKNLAAQASQAPIPCHSPDSRRRLHPSWRIEPDEIDEWISTPTRREVARHRSDL